MMLEPMFPPMLAAAENTAWSDAEITKAKTSDLVIIIASATTELRQLTDIPQGMLDTLKIDEPDEHRALDGLARLIQRQLDAAAVELDGRVPVMEQY